MGALDGFSPEEIYARYLKVQALMKPAQELDMANRDFRRKVSGGERGQLTWQRQGATAVVQEWDYENVPWDIANYTRCAALDFRKALSDELINSLNDFIGHRVPDDCRGWAEGWERLQYDLQELRNDLDTLTYENGDYRFAGRLKCSLNAIESDEDFKRLVVKLELQEMARETQSKAVDAFAALCQSVDDTHAPVTQRIEEPVNAPNAGAENTPEPAPSETKPGPWRLSPEEAARVETDVRELLKLEGLLVERQAVEAQQGAAELPDYVTLQQAAALVNLGKRALERYKQSGKIPPPDVKHSKGAGKADEWRWSTLRPVLESLFHKPLPSRFPASRFIQS
jgi:hypothetical protein